MRGDRRPERPTGEEPALRDQVLGGLLDRLPAGLTPNRLTGLRITLVLISFILYLRRTALGWQWVLLTAAACTDLFDGPLARRRGLAGLRGARLDQRADALLGLWLGVLALLEATIPLPLLLGLAVSQAAVWGSEYVVHRTIRSGLVVGRAPVPNPTAASRLQWVLVVAGFTAALAEASFGWPTRPLGACVLLGSMGAAAVQVVQNLEAKRAAQPETQHPTRT